jgi:hypothetical protein
MRSPVNKTDGTGRYCLYANPALASDSQAQNAGAMPYPDNTIAYRLPLTVNRRKDYSTNG